MNLIEIVNKLINENNRFQILSKLLKNSGDDLVKTFSDDAVRQIDNLLVKALSNPLNVGINSNGQQFLKSLRGSEVKMSVIQGVLNTVSAGGNIDELAGLLPSKLADGTDFRTIIMNQLSKGTSRAVINLSERGKKILDVLKTYSNWLTSGELGRISGWKFHIYASNVEESAYLFEKLEPIAKKWNAHFKVASKGNYDEFQKSPHQLGKGATFYIPSDVVKNGRQNELLNEIQNAISDYKVKGNIDGDNMLTNNIGLRYEFSKPVDPKIGIDVSTDAGYNKYKYELYKSQAPGSSYNIPNNPDIFLD